MASGHNPCSISSDSLARLEQAVRRIYEERSRDVPFHGWPHIEFVFAKAIEFAPKVNADESLVAAAALTHDVNYLVQVASEPDAGRRYRSELLVTAGVPPAVRERVDSIIQEAHIRTRGPTLGPEAVALSDADTLFKALPVTPVALSCLFRQENDLSVRELAEKIADEQPRLLDEGIYFYIPEVQQQYGHWASTNVRLWAQVVEALDDPAVVALLDTLGMGERAG